MGRCTDFDFHFMKNGEPQEGFEKRCDLIPVLKVFSGGCEESRFGRGGDTGARVDGRTSVRRLLKSSR